MRHLGAVLLAATALLALPAGASAQAGMELRASSTRYRFIDLNYTFKSGVMLDTLYLGVPGQNEFYLGLGWTWKARSGLTLIPLAYGVVGKEKGERGLVVGAYLLADAKGFRTIAFLGRFIRVSGGVPTYDFLDSLDLTRVLGSRWEAGVSSTVYHYEGDWSHLTGPLVRRNDPRGSWASSLRFGYDTELRLVRVITF